MSCGVFGVKKRVLKQSRLTAISASDVICASLLLATSASQICPRAGAAPESTPIERPKDGSRSRDCLHPSYAAHLAAGVASKSVKLQRPARATVCSHSVRDATASVVTNLTETRPPRVIKIARLMNALRGVNDGVTTASKVTDRSAAAQEEKWMCSACNQFDPAHSAEKVNNND